MSHNENRENDRQFLFDQVKKLLADFGGENGKFLSQPAQPQRQAINLGELLPIVLVVACPAKHIHYSDFSPTGFLKLLVGPQAQAYFENLNLTGLTFLPPSAEAGQVEPPALDENALVENVLSAEKFAEALGKVQALLDKAEIENSHLQVANDFLRLRLKKYEEAQAQDQGLTQTALDYGVSGTNKTGRRWHFGFGKKLEDRQ